jgi:L-methionine (R)-S-oxide reductase
MPNQTMADTIPDLRGVRRRDAYTELTDQLRLVLEGVDDSITGMATVCALVHGALGFLWTGFYRVVKPGELLRIGPYQGSLGCLEIPFGKGVCGTAAVQRKTLIVEDVTRFPGHISCDARSRSEIVVPVIGRSDQLIAILDVDSDEIGAFSDDDRAGLEELVQWFRNAA